MSDIPRAEPLARAVSAIWPKAHYLLFALLAGEALLFAYYGGVEWDEGWYVYASRLVFEGDVPYRDFPYFQGPVFPYLYGLPQLFLDPSFLVARATSLVFTAGAVLSVAYLANRLGGRAALLWALALMALNPVLMRFFTIARPEAAVTTLALLALAALLGLRRGMPALIVAPALLVVASGMRITLVPAFIAVLAFVFWTTNATRGQRIAAGAALLAEAFIIFGIPIVVGGERAVFDLWSSQVSRINQFAPSDPGPGVAFLDKVEQLEDLWSWYLVLLIPAVALAAHIVVRYYRGWEPRRAYFGGRPVDSQALILGLALLVFVPNVMLSPIRPYYFLPSSVLLTLAVATAVVRLPGDEEVRRIRPVLLPLVVALALLGAPTYAARAVSFLDVRHPEIRVFRDTGKVVSSYLEPGEKLFVLDPRIPVAADRRVLRGLEMGLLSYWPSFSTEKAERLGVLNRELLVQRIEVDRPRVIALSDFSLSNLAPTTPAEMRGSEDDETPFYILPELKSWYSVEHVVPRYSPFFGRLYVLVRNGVTTES